MTEYLRSLEDWNLVKAFLVVAESGSLSAAAQRVRQSQPTLSRQVAELEQVTQLNLFKRTTQGLTLTEDGEQLMAAAKQVLSGMEAFQRQVDGHSQELKGDVRISANEIVGVIMLPTAIAAFQQTHPEVKVEIVVSNQATNLSKRDADLALRMFRPTQPDLHAKRLPDLPLGFYAHDRYLRRAGQPRLPQQLFDHAIIGFDRDMQFIEGAQKLGFDLKPEHFSARTDSMLAQIALMRAGAGIVGSHVGLMEQLPQVQRVLPELVIPPLEFWVVCHSDVQFNRRIRALMAFLSTWFENAPYQHCIV